MELAAYLQEPLRNLRNIFQRVELCSTRARSKAFAINTAPRTALIVSRTHTTPITTSQKTPAFNLAAHYHHVFRLLRSPLPLSALPPPQHHRPTYQTCAALPTSSHFPGHTPYLYQRGTERGRTDASNGIRHHSKVSVERMDHAEGT